VQSSTQLTPSARPKLDLAGVKYLDYISKNTYLCQYEGGNLEEILLVDSVVYVEIYPIRLEITLSLKVSTVVEPDTIYEADAIFQQSIDWNSPDLERNL
jgi:hypothetical protein